MNRGKPGTALQRPPLPRPAPSRRRPTKKAASCGRTPGAPPKQATPFGGDAASCLLTTVYKGALVMSGGITFMRFTYTILREASNGTPRFRALKTATNAGLNEIEGGTETPTN